MQVINAITAWCHRYDKMHWEINTEVIINELSWDKDREVYFWYLNNEKWECSLKGQVNESSI